MSEQFDYVETYLQSRIQDSKSYRGVHLQQHNRLPQAKLEVLLTAIYNTVGAESFIEPSGDDPAPSRSHKVGDPWRYPKGNLPGDCSNYWEILDAIAGADVSDVSASFNSLKKNHFPNLEAMGLLSRIEGTHDSPKRAQLTDRAVEYLQANKRQRSKIFADASEKPLAPFIERLDPLLERFNIISVYEVMLFVSDFTLELDECETLIYNYKRLKQIQKLELHESIQKQMQRRMGPDVPKRQKLDWHNWLNQAQQILDHLQVVTGFVVYQNEVVMRSGDAFAASFSARRSQTVKAEAMDWHSLDKVDGWELHHVLPIDYATSEAELDRIDSKENLIYISKEAHRKFPTRSNRTVKLKFSEGCVTVFNPASRDQLPEVTLVIDVDIRLDMDNLPAMLEYNEMLLDFIS